MINCTAVIGSMTSALKAEKVLTSAAIRCTVVKLDSSVTNRGCAYGLEYDCSQDSNIHAILSASGIKVSRYMRGGGYM